MSSIASLHDGDRAVVQRITGTGSIVQRLYEMGLVEGTEIVFVRTAPLGDPVEVEVHGYHLSLRKSEAELVMVELCS